ncbi:metallophosphoesterase family protein [Streptomyces sp. NPDC048604]|uniref:metallophosphoesterase family protein n=1 Tax=Streptomyces sp. NPDC048604 TaxID=3365578 RepID=UPI00371DB875
MGSLLAVSDLHVAHPDNRAIVEAMKPTADDDWLIVAGDVGELLEDVERTLALLADRFHTVVWTPGNHELWTHPRDPVTLRGEARYRRLVETCRALGVHTPEDPYPVWRHPDGRPVTVAPLFTLYDYTWRPAGAETKEQSLAVAKAAGIVCTDEHVLHPDPWESREAWCAERIRYTEQRLQHLELTDDQTLVLVNHYPLVRDPTSVLWHPEFAQWCGTERTADWHVRHPVELMVYGHLHIPRTTHHDGVRFEEVSVGYPREWRKRTEQGPWPRQVLPKAD